MTLDLTPFKWTERDTHQKVTKMNATLDAIQAVLNATSVGVYNILGFHDASTEAYPSSPSANDAWVISVAGTIDGTAYVVGNLIGYTGSAWVILNEGGQSAYLYVAYAADSSGTGFATTPDASRPYAAIKATSAPIAEPAAGDFAGLWQKYLGDDGADGADGEDADIAADTHAASSKATPVDADELPLVDSAASNVLKKLTWANLKATIKTYSDTLYQAKLVSGTNIKTINSTSLLGSGDIAVGGPGDHCVTVHTGNGFGSTNSRVRRWTTVLESTGSAITYADSATNGGSFTIATGHGGLYEFMCGEVGLNGIEFAVTVNSSQLTSATAVASINIANRLAYGQGIDFLGAVDVYAPATRTVKLAAGDVVRVQPNANPSSGNNKQYFSIRKVGNV